MVLQLFSTSQSKIQQITDMISIILHVHTVASYSRPERVLHDISHAASQLPPILQPPASAKTPPCRLRNSVRSSFIQSHRFPATSSTLCVTAATTTVPDRGVLLSCHLTADVPPHIRSKRRADPMAQDRTDVLSRKFESGESFVRLQSIPTSPKLRLTRRVGLSHP